MQAPQGLDARHGSELFPVEESRGTPTRLGLGLAGRALLTGKALLRHTAAGRFLVRQGVDALRLPVMLSASRATREKPGAHGTGLSRAHPPRIRNPLTCSNSDTTRPWSTHGGELLAVSTRATYSGKLFPIDESSGRLLDWALADARCGCNPQLDQSQRKHRSSNTTKCCRAGFRQGLL